jgi:formate dehydrogenase subunit delta
MSEMGSHQLNSMIKMLNQIAANTPNQHDSEKVIGATENHMRKFWAKSMKAEIIAYLESGGDELSERAEAAVRRLQSESAVS